MRSFLAIYEKGNKPVIPFEKKDNAEFSRLNKAGYGIFATVNDFDATKEQMKEAGVRTIRNDIFCTRINAVYGDLDIAKKGDGQKRADKEEKKNTLEKALLDFIPPNFIIYTSNGLQPIWKIKEGDPTDENKATAKKIINGIIEWSKKHGAMGDAVKDISRVLRVPGYDHMKEEPFPVTMKKFVELPYTMTELEMAFPFEEKVETKIVKRVDKSCLSDGYREVEAIDFKDLVIRAFKGSGREAVFDNKGRLVLDGRLTGNFIGKVGNDDFMASTSHEPFEGNRVTVVGQILNLSNKEAYKWICEEFDIKKRVKIHKKEEIKERVDLSKKRDVLAQFRKKQEENNRTWGVDSLDKRFYKPEKENYILLLGAPGVGKTSFCLHMAIQNAKNGIKTLFISLEMSKEAVEERYIEIYAGITEEDRVSAEYDNIQEAKMIECKEELEHENFKIIDEDDIGKRLDVDILEALAENFDVVFIDNLSFMTPRDEKTYTAQSAASLDITNWMKRTKKTVIVLHHLTKNREAMAGSQKLEDDCSIRVDLYQQEDEEDKSKMCFHVKKSRRRGKGLAYVFFDKAKYKGEDIATASYVSNVFDGFE